MSITSRTGQPSACEISADRVLASHIAESGNRWKLARRVGGTGKRVPDPQSECAPARVIRAINVIGAVAGRSRDVIAVRGRRARGAARFRHSSSMRSGGALCASN